MNFIAEYGMFFAKFMTVLITLLIIVGGIFIISMRAKSADEGHLIIKNLNQKFETMNLLLQSHILSKAELKKSKKNPQRRTKEKR